MFRAVLLIAAAVVLAAPISGVTHAPPPWSSRLVRAAGPQRQERAIQAGDAAATPGLVADQVQRHLQRLGNLSRDHLQSWLSMYGQPKPQPQQQTQPQHQPAQTLTEAPPADAGSPVSLPSSYPVRKKEEVKTPSKCVFAIVTCCQTSTSEVRYACFELLECVGPFWDQSPCEHDILSASLAQVAKYYGQKPREKS